MLEILLATPVWERCQEQCCRIQAGGWVTAWHSFLALASVFFLLHSYILWHRKKIEYGQRISLSSPLGLLSLYACEASDSVRDWANFNRLWAQSRNCSGYFNKPHTNHLLSQTSSQRSRNYLIFSPPSSYSCVINTSSGASGKRGG